MAKQPNKAAIRPEAAVVLEVPEKHLPKKFNPDQLTRGTSVFYGNERFYIETPSLDWSVSPFVRISSTPIHPDLVREPSKDRISQCVHVDLLELAPVNKKGIYHKQPTKAAVDRKERQKATGVTDAGDLISDTLRGRSLEDVYIIASNFLNSDIDAMKSKYGHLNPGQQRMNLGNRMRAHAKKEGMI